MRECSSDGALLRGRVAIGAAAAVCLALIAACQNQARTAPMPPALTLASPSITKVADVGLNQPENVVYDSVADLYYVSNMGPGAADKHDDNGFISQIAPDGHVVKLRWIAGGQNGVALDAPKGLTICADTLVVADVNAVRLFSRKTGAWVRSINLPGTRLNDVACARDGALWVSDAGPARGASKLDTTEDVDGIWRIGRDRSIVSEARGLALERPEGIVLDSSGAALVATFAGNRVERVAMRDPKARAVVQAASSASPAPANRSASGRGAAGRDGAGRGAAAGGRGAGRGGAAPAVRPGLALPPDSAHVVTTLPVGEVAALRRLPDGSLVTTSWEGKSVYLVGTNGEPAPIVTGINSPSGVAVDTRHHRLAVTSTQTNTLYFVPLPTTSR